MSDKIKSKDLSYDSSLPPFLQRLHEQKAGRGDTDRHERPIARAKRTKNPDDDDGPTVVDDSGETVSKAQLEEMSQEAANEVQDTSSIKGELDPSTEPKASGALPDSNASTRRTEASVTDGTAQKKRKAAKVIGNDEEAGGAAAQDSMRTTAKKVKKAKPVKLTFEDDEEG
ncbi:uncharacterized protein MYCFIDRAFT_82111 [Pseudocercospora fijiensis CIRAD86]|uniref:DUF4604 domain-containing protein n=1 Tax=Pseudocercospora fijiensis (strain CIRAD86) TaxID=383855 RepID=M3BAA3_PSEFD|nr:uncharacterized protein MYCFIDRAFT_82111 [Pseudocercospora fijiensis CIRAD86]EME86183.1 hypothetical protein MYCFIDRAFT_82111 [Pseudocercospora fijiensis CIRAD86]